MSVDPADKSSEPKAASPPTRSPQPGWQFWIDRGGTFTDVVALRPNGLLTAIKLLSLAPEQYSDAAIAGIDRLLAAHPEEPRRISAVKIGTTIGTNALLERRGAATLLVTTEGFGDVLRIGTQQRPELFVLDIRLPEQLYERVIEARERISPAGAVLTKLDEQHLERELRQARAAGIESVAIAFLHGYKFTAHEQLAAALARKAGFAQISVSSELSPRIKLVERGRTAVADAYLSPVITSYVDRLRAELERRQPGVTLLFMQSHGGLIEAEGFRGHNCILSGPAGGVVGMARTASRAGHQHVIGFDMGGTSTDVSLYAGAYERADATHVAGTTLAVPAMRIHTVAAGGGSILDYRDGRLQVGPESAGAFPGPACYGHDGPATLTDANVLLGRIQPDFFPRVFGPGGSDAINVEAAKQRMNALVARINADQQLDLTMAAAGFLEIAVDHMAAAIEQISIHRGHDPRLFALACFGGAGGQHACMVAEALGIERIVIDPLAGVLSAYGIGIADLRRIRAAPVERLLDDGAMAAITAEAERLMAELRADFEAGAADVAPRFELRLLLRQRGTDTLLATSFELGRAAAAIIADFESSYRARFGFDPASPAIVVDRLEVEAIGTLRHPQRPEIPPAIGPAAPVATHHAWISGQWRATPVYRRAELGAGSRIEGPAIVVEPNATTIVDAGWTAGVAGDGTLEIERRADAAAARTPVSSGDAERDPVMLEIFNNQFMHVAEQMGAVLEQTAESVNIRERLDYSCALFDPAGALIANAPHVPVHLGSMSDSVRAVLARFPQMAQGDSFALNAPYAGGTHLPDVTVVTPLVDAASGRPAFFVASRAHHADVGGTTPGSMPALSTRIDEEGVVIEPLQVVRRGRLLEGDVRRALAQGPFPARNPDRNLADLRAQLAANMRGISELARLQQRHGPELVRAYTDYVQDNAEECVRDAITALHSGSGSVGLDGGERIEVAVRVDRERRSAVIDFTGTSGPSVTNFNAPASIARAAVLYVFRCLIRHNIPLNEGCLAPLTIVLPENSLVDPKPPAAVVAGNVETSQCIVDALLAALDAAAASQGTMNNFTFGDASHQYYETICGGCGAGPGFDGASAVHSHMTNSRLTDPEVLEQRYPVRIRRFAVRRGSGGQGRWRGGDGVIRAIEFLAPMTGSILSNRRATAPFGLDGGAAGAPGRNYLIRASGETIVYGATAELSFDIGDCLVIETPGGGGYGAAAGPSSQLPA